MMFNIKTLINLKFKVMLGKGPKDDIESHYFSVYNRIRVANLFHIINASCLLTTST